MAESTYITNFSYIFVPFSIEREEDFADFNASIMESGLWKQDKKEIRYIHRYVSERLTSGRKDANMHRYSILKNNPARLGIHLNNGCYKLPPKTFGDEKCVTFDFTINDVQLFSFNTSIGIMAFKLQFMNSDPRHIAGAQYYLRKADTSVCYEQEEQKNFIKITKDILGSLVDEYKIEVFFFATPGVERANFFTYLDIPCKNNLKEDLFYLKWCYHEKFEYDPNCEEEDSIDYAANANTVWGISPSAAVCTVNRCDDNKSFVENTFQGNFQTFYLFTYILLLHQKYMIYLLLTKVSVGIGNDLERLENYKRRLYEFETDYMFSTISEVPQYQRFYEKVMSVFSIKKMFSDVQEPLTRLAEIKRQKEDERKQIHDHNINAALTMLSILTVVSSLADAAGSTANLGWLFSPNVSKIIQSVLIFLVLGLSIFMIIRLILIKYKK